MISSPLSAHPPELSHDNWQAHTASSPLAGSSSGRLRLCVLTACTLALAIIPSHSAEAPAAALAPAPAAKPPAAAPAPDPAASSSSAFVPGTGSRTDVKPFYFAIPAPRGQILDRKGRPFAQNTLVRRLQFTVPADQRSTLETYTAWLQKEIDSTKTDLSMAHLPDADTLKRHYESRRELPITVSDSFTQDLVIDPQKHAHASLRTEYIRHYPHQGMAAHLLGYIASEGAPPSGPILRNEPLWQRTKGATGLEAAFNTQLTGTDGTLCLMMADAGSVAYEQVFTPPAAGRDVITTLNLETQRLTESALAQSKHRCAMVIVDAFSGDIRAMASLPHYDPNAFAGGISSADFTALTQDIDGPLFDRTLLGTYPPGSIFKPIVVFAGLRAGMVDASMEFECGPSLMIDGREFKNWSKDDHGWFNARSALIRSCNTYFYQSAMVMRDRPILYMAHEFGLGTAPAFPLKTAAGNLPQKAPSNHDLANLSIGQGVTETSPLQMAMVMATIANGSCRPRARIVTHTQSQTGRLGDVSIPCREALIPVSQMDLETVRSGMFGVVNHARGTGKAARLKSVAVFGKTGTAQWVLRGEKANVVWFAGFVDTNPPLAFAVMVEGDAGQGGLSGGGTAAPIIAKVLHDIEDRPKAHDVKFEPDNVPEESDPLSPDYTQPEPAYYGGGPSRYRDEPSGIGGFFQRIFR